jgi:hypothetical protein
MHYNVFSRRGYGQGGRIRKTPKDHLLSKGLNGAFRDLLISIGNYTNHPPPLAFIMDILWFDFPYCLS